MRDSNIQGEVRGILSTMREVFKNNSEGVRKIRNFFLTWGYMAHNIQTKVEAEEPTQNTAEQGTYQ